MSPYDNEDQGCHDDNCASDVWKDGCLACMCIIMEEPHGVMEQK